MDQAPRLTPQCNLAAQSALDNRSVETAVFRGVVDVCAHPAGGSFLLARWYMACTVGEALAPSFWGDNAETACRRAKMQGAKEL
jgi:hypothetical protein